MERVRMLCPWKDVELKQANLGLQPSKQNQKKAIESNVILKKNSDFFSIHPSGDWL